MSRLEACNISNLVNVRLLADQFEEIRKDTRASRRRRIGRGLEIVHHRSVVASKNE